MSKPMTPAEWRRALAAEDVSFREYDGWETHERDDETGKTFGPVYGIAIHHTAGRNDLDLCYKGRRDLPGPLCHGWIGKTSGLWMLSAGRSNHAGLVDDDVVRALIAEAPLPVDNEANYDGNDCLYGFEIENLGDGEDPYPADQYQTAVRAAAAVCRHHGWTEKSIAGHKDLQPGKIDPSFSMTKFREDVRQRLAAGAGAPTAGAGAVRPTVSLSRLRRAALVDPGKPQGYKTYMTGTNIVENALVKLGLMGKRYAGDGSFGSVTVDGYSDWQKQYSREHNLGWSGSDVDGIPGRTSLTALGRRTGLFTVVD